MTKERLLEIIKEARKDRKWLIKVKEGVQFSDLIKKF